MDLDVRFTCKGCGKCCRRYEVPLLMRDVDRLAGEVDRSFVRVLVHGKNVDPVLTKREWDLGCVFLDPEALRCSVHPHRPTACRLYPFALSRTPVEGGRAFVELDGERLTLVAFRSCPEVGEGEPMHIWDLIALHREVMADERKSAPAGDDR